MTAPDFEKLTRPVCRLCPRRCEVDRSNGEIGVCLAGPLPVISQAGPHHGEEPPLSGRNGSGTIFLSGCNLHCVFCQNADISSCVTGREMDAGELAETALLLERRGCHNINFVTPTHHADVIADAVDRARRQGLKVPVVYNCGGYESPETLKCLNGRIDIYMPDIKFFDEEACRGYLQAADYAKRVREALKIMQDQVSDLVVRDGLAVRGLLIRHLVMPGFMDDARAILDFIQQEVSPHATVNVMGQYRPTSGTANHPAIQRAPLAAEVDAVREHARKLGLIICS